MNKLTLEQIGKLAGVSRSTVSRVINNQASVKPEVRQRVRSVIKQTGYQPNLAARSLASQRSGIIGLVIPRIVQSLFTDPYFPHLMQGIAQGCNANDYLLSLFLFHTEDEEQKLYPRVLQAGLIDGVIIASTFTNDRLISQLVENEMPFVTIGRPDHAPQASFVDVDNVIGAYTAITHLMRLGYKRIATISGPQNMVAGIDRQQGYLNALNDRGYSINPALIVEGDFTELGGYSAMQRLLPHRPDAVFIASDSMALGALRALREVGLSVPGNIAIVGFDDLPPATISDPPLTTVRQPIRQTGIQAVEILIDIVTNGLEPPRRIIMNPHLVIRASCGMQERLLTRDSVRV